jgi:hypothetical protein
MKIDAEKILKEVKEENGIAWTLLRAKCRTEGYGLLKTIREFGDPRKWPAPITATQ